MAGTCQQDEVLCDWKTIFPDFSTIEGSRLFIKKLIAISVSAVTYFRGIFPERAYGERKLGGIKLKVLTEDSGLESVGSFIELIRSCYDAVDKKYLQQLNIGICRDPKNKNEVIESYNLMFRYSDTENSITCNKQKSSSLTSSDPTVQATLMMLKHIHSVNEILEDIPKNSFLTIKLLYYDDVTPPDYEPAGFEPTTCEKFTYPAKTLKLSIGTVETKLSGYKMYLKSTLVSNPTCFSDEAILRNTQERSEQKMLTRPEDYEEHISTPEPQSGTKEKLKNEFNQKNRSCPCKCKKEKQADLITCVICEKDQHKTCYGILHDDETPDQFCCVYCFPFAATDIPVPDIIYSSKSKEQQNLCAMRRAILLVSKQNYVSLYTFEKELGCNKPLAKSLIEQLVSEDVVAKMNRNKYKVNEKKLHMVILKYFPNQENQENKVKVKKSPPETAENLNVVNNVQKDKFNITQVLDHKRKQNKRKSSALEKLSTQSSPEISESSIEDSCELISEEVEGLDINEPEEKQPSQRKRKSCEDENNDSSELFSNNPKKRKCLHDSRQTLPAAVTD